jgi:hypothetical protein
MVRRATQSLHPATLNRASGKNSGLMMLAMALALRGALRQIAQAATGSVALFTYIHRDVLDRPEGFFGAKEASVQAPILQ